MRSLSISKSNLEHLSARRIGMDSLLLSGTMSGLIIFIARFNPEILDRVGEVSDKTKKQRLLFFVPSLLLLLGIPLRSNLLLKKQNKGELTFFSAFFNAYSISVITNLFDLLVLDYLVLIHWQPAFLKLPIARLNPIYMKHSFHFKAFLRGLILMIIPNLVLAAVSKGSKKASRSSRS